MKTNKDMIVDEKISSLKTECDHLYDQITELRTTVQEIYGEMAESDRFFTKELFRISERLEAMAKEISSIPIKNSSGKSVVVKVSPTTNISPTMENVQMPEFKKEESGFLFNSFGKSPSIWVAIFIGFFAVVGAFCIFVYKIMSLLQFLI